MSKNKRRNLFPLFVLLVVLGLMASFSILKFSAIVWGGFP